MAAGVYLHIPFCKSRCSYCDFATDVWRSGDAVERYVDAICLEVAVSEPAASAVGKTFAEGRSSFETKLPPLAAETFPPAYAGGSDIDTIYFGGGTPSLLQPFQVEKILNAVREIFEVSADTEITMEMNPATVTPESLLAFREMGVNRASFGVQTFDDRELKLLARGHDANDARQTFTMLRNAGFDNISLDLIAGLPGQTMSRWQQNLDEALAMHPEHISLYLLEIHEATPLAEQVRSGRRPMPNEELAAEMYEIMLDRLTAAGYEQYEISNFAKPDFQSQHNTKYWRLDPVYGFGVSAHSFDGNERYANLRDTNDYVNRIENFASAENYREQIDAASEFIFLGLRLTAGIDTAEYERRFGHSLAEKYAEEISSLKDAGLIEQSGQTIRLTRKGMLFSNNVFEAFI